MANPDVDDAVLQETVDAYEKYGSQKSAAAALGISRSTFRSRHSRAKVQGVTPGGAKQELEFPVFPEGVTAEELINHLTNRFEKTHAKHLAERWFSIKVNSEQPIGLAFMGDPHVDNHGCNWPLLRRHCEILEKTDGLYGIGMGDYTDNWVGRLQRLYANNPTTREEAIVLVEWLISGAGIDWMALIRGNHDMWSPGRDDPLTWMQRGGAPMVDWRAQFTLDFPNGAQCRIDARHDFKGHSMWNSAHGMQKAAHMKEPAHIYAAGHTHNWVLHQEESGSKDFTYWLLRARGYKFDDEYADLLGHDPQEYGATILAVIDPQKDPKAPNFVQCFADLEEGAEYLTWKRR